MEQKNPKTTDFSLLHRSTGTYALILQCLHQRNIGIGKFGKINVSKGCYVYVGSAFGFGGLSARIKRHCQISKSFHWHIDYLRPAMEIHKVWYSLDPIKREHQWADVFTRTHGVKLPSKGFGSSDCNCDSHLFFFDNAPSIKTFRKQVEQAILDHQHIEWIDKDALPFPTYRKKGKSDAI